MLRRFIIYKSKNQILMKSSDEYIAGGVHDESHRKLCIELIEEDPDAILLRGGVLEMDEDDNLKFNSFYSMREKTLTEAAAKTYG